MIQHVKAEVTKTVRSSPRVPPSMNTFRCLTTRILSCDADDKRFTVGRGKLNALKTEGAHHVRVVVERGSSFIDAVDSKDVLESV